MSREKLLMIPGPTPVVPRILERLACPTVSHVSKELAADMLYSREMLKKVLFCHDGEPFIISGAGTLAMEMALLNVCGPKDKVLVVSQGYFGRRMADICAAFGLAHDMLECDWGGVVSADELAAGIGSNGYSVVVCTHVDTATGACSPVEAYARVVRASGAIFIVDGVCATGGLPERMDDWGIDIVLTAAQKCFGTPPGLSLLALSQKAMEKRRGLPSVPAYYGDLLRWLPVMKDPFKYFSTPAVNEMRAFAESLRIIEEEGVEARFVRHDLIGLAMRAGLAALGFGSFTQPGALAGTLSVAVYPAGIEDKAFRTLLDENGVVVAGGLGATAGKVFRMGHMGNITTEDVMFTLKAVERTLAALSPGGIKPGEAEKAAALALGK